MAFSTRRGRPPADPLLRGRDFGTPELIRKRAEGQTAETLDWCLNEGYLSEKEHAAGMKLRWLHSLRFGCPTVRALDLSGEHGRDVRRDEDSEWRQAREEEYLYALHLLRMGGMLAATLNLCIYQLPLTRSHPVLALGRQGLRELAAHWSREPASV